jgi:hypothetical protein
VLVHQGVAAALRAGRWGSGAASMTTAATATARTASGN